MTKGDWMYIMTNRYRGGMYVGVTADLTRRVYQHRIGEGSQHVADFGKTHAVFAERHEDIVAASRAKNWSRSGGANGSSH